MLYICQKDVFTNESVAQGLHSQSTSDAPLRLCSKMLFVTCLLSLFVPPSLLLSFSPLGLGRWKNSEYLQFISILDENKDNHTPANKVSFWNLTRICCWN